MQGRTAIPQIVTTLVLLAATLGLHPSDAASASSPAAALFAQLCGDVGGADASLPAYPNQPNPTGNGVVVNIENASDLNDLLRGTIATPPPGSVISIASGVYSDMRWTNSGGAGIGFAGTAAHPITWYARQQYGVEVTAQNSYRAMQLKNSDAHHRFVGFHMRDGRELFLSEANGTEFLHGRVSGSTAGGAWKWRGVDGGPTANGMRFMYNVVSTANSGSNFGRLEGVYIGDGQLPQLLNTRQTNFEISHNCIVDAPGGAIDIKANSTNGIVANNYIDSTDHISGGINALPGWHHLSSSVRANDPNVRSANNRITVSTHPNSSQSNAGAGLRVNGTWRSTNDVVINSSNAGFFVLAQANLELTVTGFESRNNRNGAARRGGSGAIALESSGNVIERQGSLVLSEASPQPTTPTTAPPSTTSTTPPTTARPTTTTAPTTAAPSTTIAPTTSQQTSVTTPRSTPDTNGSQTSTTAAPRSPRSADDNAPPTTSPQDSTTTTPPVSAGADSTTESSPNEQTPSAPDSDSSQAGNDEADDEPNLGEAVSAAPPSTPNTFPASPDITAAAEPTPETTLTVPGIPEDSISTTSTTEAAPESTSTTTPTEPIQEDDETPIEASSLEPRLDSDRNVDSAPPSGLALVEIDDAPHSTGLPIDLRLLAMALVVTAAAAALRSRQFGHSS